jgi:2-dehydro-3-deoxy-D-arabinonate dehydratase
VRSGIEVFAGETSTAELTRELSDLTEHLVRALSLPDGAILLTGTGIVPAAPFTLLPGDTVRIEIDGLGVLQNAVIEVGRAGS